MEEAEPEEAAESLQRCKETVGCAAKGGKNFTWARTEGANRKCEQSTEPEETAETVQRRKGKVAKRRNNGRKFTWVRTEGTDRKCEQKCGTVGSGRNCAAV